MNVRCQTNLSKQKNENKVPLAETQITDNTHTHTHARTRTFNGPLSGTTPVSRYQKGKTNLDFTETRDCEWQWHQLGHMQVCTSFQTDNQASTPPLMLGHDSEVKNSNKVLHWIAKVEAMTIHFPQVSQWIKKRLGSVKDEDIWPSTKHFALTILCRSADSTEQLTDPVSRVKQLLNWWY